jgi:hypothetical protein
VLTSIKEIQRIDASMSRNGDMIAECGLTAV